MRWAISITLLAALLVCPLLGQESSSSRATSSKAANAQRDSARARDERSKTEKSKGDKTKTEKLKDEKVPGFTLEREAAALSFVEQHHPELSELLARLKKSNRRGYQQAINELFRTSERLAMSKERDSARYDFELRIWKLDSRIRLLAARWSMSSSPALEEELKALLLEKADVQIEQKLFERQRLATRLEKLDATIQRARQQREAKAQESLDVLLRDVKQWQPAKGSPRSGSLPRKSSPGGLDAATASTPRR
jgi:hypothetical protein